MSNAAEVMSPIVNDDTSFHQALGDCLTRETRTRLLALRRPAERPEVVETTAPQKSDDFETT